MNYLILNQLGTPDNCDPESVGRYLTEFLMDRNVINLPRPFRDILVRIGIVPRRKYSSAKKYKKIWSAEGSPLAVHTRALQQKLQARLGDGWTVLVGMRYGNPSLEQALYRVDFTGASRVLFLPLYPHHAKATVGSAVEKLQSLTSEPVHVMPVFYKREWYINAFTRLIEEKLAPQDHLILSYHGLPVSQNVHNGISYHAQCLETSALLREKLGLPEERITTAFQSRVGVNKWLLPSTQDCVREILQKGVKHVKVACPSFMADCLETLEEIGIELREEFLTGGGESFERIDCPNSGELIVDALFNEVKAFNK